ncbi:hypothetical protein [Arenimonas daejeonensis]|uniref:hypothetical protein n=1 Tax=Arenimonas daejeonensis TaxID=370777 RepID=UPI0011BE3910|nr:hypothetical protein [Arenimonas daejeonensis]
MDSRQERKNLAQRRKLGRALGVAAALGLVLLLAFEFWLRRTQAQAEHDPDSAVQAVGAVSSCSSSPRQPAPSCSGDSCWTGPARRAGRTNGRRPGWNFQNAPLRHGSDALRIARRLQAAGLISLAVALAVVLAVAWRWLA